MKKAKLLLAGALLTIFNLAAQTTIPNVLQLKSAKNSGTIVENNKVVGYYVFYQKEKVDKNNNAYEIEVFDDNYNSTASFEITRSKKSLLLEMVYNGEAFMLQFYDSKAGLEFVTFDRSGKQLGKKLIDKDNLSKWETARIAQNLQSETENVSIFPMGPNGFARNTYVKNNKLGYEIVAYDNSCEEIWSYGADPASKLMETSDIVDVSENLVTITVSKKKGAMTKVYDQFCLILDAKTGKKIEEFQLGSDEEGRMSILKSSIDEINKKIILVGEYWKAKDDYLKDKSLGIYVMELTHEGEITSTTKYAWKGDIDKFKQENMDEEDKKEAGKPFGIFFHDIVFTSNGSIFLIGEQYRKQVSAGGIAANVAVAALGGQSNAGATEVRIGNMIVIELDANKNIVDFDIVQKRKSTVNVNGGAYMSSSLLGAYMKALGAYDYAFTSQDKSKDQFDVVYVDLNRKEEKGAAKSDLMIGVISIRDGKTSTQRIPINSTAKMVWFQAAKPGFISIGEYFRKEKKLSFHMESIAE